MDILTARYVSVSNRHHDDRVSSSCSQVHDSSRRDQLPTILSYRSQYRLIAHRGSQTVECCAAVFRSVGAQNPQCQLLSSFCGTAAKDVYEVVDNRLETETTRKHRSPPYLGIISTTRTIP